MSRWNLISNNYLTFPFYFIVNKDNNVQTITKIQIIIILVETGQGCPSNTVYQLW